jgi:hypothetical protein
MADESHPNEISTVFAAAAPGFVAIRGEVLLSFDFQTTSSSQPQNI